MKLPPSASLRGLIESLPDVVLVSRESGEILFANERTHEMLGYRPEELIGKNVDTLLPRRLRERHAILREGYLQAPQLRTLGERGELKAQRKDGSELTVEIALSPHRTRDTLLVITTLRDVTRRHRAEQELRLLQELTLAISAATDLEEALEETLRRVLEAAGWVAGAIWIPQERADSLEPGPVWADTPTLSEKLPAALQTSGWAEANGLPALAVSTRQAQWLEDLPSDVESEPLGRLAHDHGLSHALALPVLSGAEAAAVLVFFLGARARSDERLIALVSAALAPLGPLLARKRTEEELRVGREEAQRVLEERVRERTEHLAAANEALRASEERFRDMADALPAMISVVDRELRYSFCNGAYERWFGLPRHILVGRHVREVIGEATARMAIPRMEAALAGEPQTFEVSLPNPDLGLRAVQVQYLPRGGPRGEVEGFYALVQDITELKQAQEAVRRSELRLRLMVEHLPAGAVFREGKSLIVNKAVEELTGYPREELRTVEDWFQHLFRENAATARELYERDRRAGFPGTAVVPITRSDDQLRFVEFAGYGFEQGEVWLVHDVTEQHNAERTRAELMARQVSVQEEERRRVALELHDQLGQYLAALSLGLDSLSRDPSVSAPVARSLGELRALSDRLADEIHRLATELRPPALDDLGLPSALRRLVEDWARHTGVEAEFDTTGLEDERLSSPVATALYRVVQEALTNVHKHARAHHVSVLLARGSDHILTIVEDDGRGFDARGAHSTHHLGLSGMRERMGMVGGTLEIESRKGRGTTLFAKVPLASHTH